ncbi:MAG TPA: hypothetical protein VFT30_00105, partial [Nitrospira sp.]|nr:hypothetical protein [Nitrospira sp.]
GHCSLHLSELQLSLLCPFSALKPKGTEKGSPGESFSFHRPSSSLSKEATARQECLPRNATEPSLFLKT